MLLDEETSLSLHALEMDLPQECDHDGECAASVEWEAVCRLCGGYGYLCTKHCKVAAEHQRIADAVRGGTRCTACREAATELLAFSPVRSRDERKLW
ncbi:hypothetical protein [Microbacterium sp. 5K110]|uniref:hypothetical protein n=1 Tax=Microbacterium sp. 5K110 TaxID=2578104 RepID=UPI0010FCE02B|nr:hypothetical protein [Microbacterium sp. 5K110]TLF33249.1 hypothetical protein FE256_03915 [Microbacterium sp. 5K110]